MEQPSIIRLKKKQKKKQKDDRKALLTPLEEEKDGLEI